MKLTRLIKHFKVSALKFGAYFSKICTYNRFNIELCVQREPNLPFLSLVRFGFSSLGEFYINRVASPSWNHQT